MTSGTTAVQALARIVYIVTASVEPAWEDEYNRWYNEEHIPNLLAVPGYRGARRYVALDGAPKYMALWEIDSLAAYRSPEHDVAANTPWSARLRPHAERQFGFYEQFSPESGLLPGAAWNGGNAEEKGLLVVRLDLSAAPEDEFEEWYGQEHLPALCAVPGVIAGRLFRAIEGGPKYMAIYHLTEPSVQASPAWQQAAMTPWTLRMRRLIPERWRVVYQPIQ